MFDLSDLVTLTSFLVIKPTLILLLTFWLVKQFAYGSAAAQFYCLSLGVASLLGLPLAVALLPAIEIAVLPAQMPNWELSAPFSGAVALVVLLAAVYLLGFFWVVFYTASGVVMVYRQCRRCLPCRDRQTLAQLGELCSALSIGRPIRVVVAPALRTPQVWGWLRPTLMVPPALMIWSPERRRRVLIHELSHIQRNDWLLLMMTKLVCALFWFIPLTWIAGRRLQTMAELACDDRVVAMEGRLDYAEDLISMVKQSRHQAHSDVVLAAVAPSQLADRIRALLDGARDRDHFSAVNRVLLCLLGLSALLPLSSLQATGLPDAVSRVKSYLSQPLVPIEAATTAAAPAPVVGPDAEDLAELKARLVDDRQPPGPMEQLLIIADHKSAIGDDWVDGIKQPLLGAPLLHTEVQIQGYMPLVTVTPIYPARARRRGQEGQVIVQFTISPQGRVEQPRIVASQPERMFDRAVLKALQGFRFRPYYIEGEAVAVSGVTEKFIFQLSEPDPAGERRRRPAFTGPTQIARADAAN